MIAWNCTLQFYHSHPISDNATNFSILKLKHTDYQMSFKRLPKNYTTEYCRGMIW
jgi:hypothetical protein